MRWFFIAGIVVVGAGVVLWTTQQSGAPAPAPVQEQGASALPEPLNLQFLAEIPDPKNPCSNLAVSQEIQNKRSQIAKEARKAEERAKAVREKIALPLEIERGNPERKSVALTIDTGTGGSYGTEELLAIASHYRIPLTFFLTGCWVLESPELVQRIVAEGHDIANHSLTHLNLGRVSDEVVQREIGETDRILKEITGITPLWFRKPHYAGGERITRIAAGFGKISVQGFPDFGDTTGWRTDTTREDVLRLVTAKTAPGAIWVFHNLSPADLGAFEEIVRFHLQEGYAIVRLDEMLAP